MVLNSLKDLLLHELRDLYSAERQLMTALPEMVNAASSDELKQAFRDHLKETTGQIRRLDQIFTHLGEVSTGEHCDAMEGLIKEARGILKHAGDPDVKDAALIASAQRIEHYEIAGYGTAKAFADRLGYDQVKDLLDETLDQEGDANKTLNKLAVGGLFTGGINKEAIYN